jgi:hypothetical protein
MAQNLPSQGVPEGCLQRGNAMEFIVIMIGIVIVIAIVMFAVVLGGVGMIRNGPRPHEGDKNSG